MAENRKILDRDIKLLWGRSAGLCSNCRAPLSIEASRDDREALTGQMAHIVAHSHDGPRADRSLSHEERRGYPNLILLCANCHTLIDQQPTTYSEEVLLAMKSKHEKWVLERLSERMPEVGFAELEVVCKKIVGPVSVPTSELGLTPPREKLAKNGLSSEIEFLIQTGMLKSGEVAEYLANISAFDSEFPERLKAGFVARYQSARESGLVGDALFLDMHHFASADGDAVRAAAGLAVVVYLFETCEIFER